MAFEASLCHGLLTVPTTNLIRGERCQRTRRDAQNVFPSSQFLGFQLSQGRSRGNRIRVPGRKDTNSRVAGPSSSRGFVPVLASASSQPGSFLRRKLSKGSQPRDVSASVGVAPRRISVSPDISINQELLQQQMLQQQQQQLQKQQQQQQQQENQQQLEQRLSREPATKSDSSTKPSSSASNRLAETSSRLHDLLLELSAADTLDAKDAILSADPRVRAVFPQRGHSLRKFVKPAVRMAMESCNQEELYLLKCLVAAGQEHLLDTPVAWAETLELEREKQVRIERFGNPKVVSDRGSDAASDGGIREAFSMLASMINGWDAHSEAPRSALPGFLAQLDNPSVFPAPLVDLIDWEDRRSAARQDELSSLSSASLPSLSSSLFEQFMEGLEYPSVFGAPLLDLVDWERQWQSDDSASPNSSRSSSSSSSNSSSSSSSSNSSSNSSSSNGFVSDGGGSTSGSDDNADYGLKVQEPRVQLQSLLAMLRRVEKFYDGIGGIIGYQSTCLDLIQQSVAASQQVAAAAAATQQEAAAPAAASAAAAEVAPISSAAEATENAGLEGSTPEFESQRRFFVPYGQDLASDPDLASQAAFWGLQGLPSMAEIYPLGGAGDRLGLVDEKTGESLPVAMLEYCGRTLLHGLLRDLEAREYLHYRVFGERHVTPVAIMTSAAKRNHQRVLSLLQQHNWFGRGEENFRLFEQPLVPTVAAEDGQWLASGPLAPVLKPGGHGVLWKLAADEGVFDWLRTRGRKAAVVRQISNPLAATDMTLLALSGIGLHGNKAFGFASCDRNVGSAQGVNVLTEQQQADGTWAYGVTCVEYTEFDRLGITDTPVAPGSSRSLYPTNTNVLYADLEVVERVVRGEGGFQGENLREQEQEQEREKELQLPCCGPALNSGSRSSASSNSSSSSYEDPGRSSDSPCAGLCGPDSTIHAASRNDNSSGRDVIVYSSNSGAGSRSGVSKGSLSRSRRSNSSSSSSSSSSSGGRGSSSSPPSLPGMIMNLKKSITFEDSYGRTQSIRGGRLECTMQNIADQLTTSLPHRVPLDAITSSSSSSESSFSSSQSDEATAQEEREGGGAQVQQEQQGFQAQQEQQEQLLQQALGTFLVYNDRRKVTSSAKRRRKPTDTSLHQTPDGSFLDLNRNSLELFSSCGIAMPHMHSDHKRYVDTSPPFIFVFHPALGPLWSVIRQKVQGGSVAPKSEVKLEIAELAWSNVHVSGSLLIEADSPTGSLDPVTGTNQLGHRCGRCRLQNVTVTNQGVDWDCLSNVYWQHRVERKEALRVVLRGDAEFEARDVTIEGDRLFEVPKGHRMVVFASESGAVETRLEKLPGRQPSWEWQYSVGDHGDVKLTLVPLPASRSLLSSPQPGAVETRLEPLPGKQPSWEWQYAVGDHGDLKLSCG